MPSSLTSFELAMLASLLAGLATGVGALPIFALRRVEPRTQAAMLGFGAGVMLAATAFSLLLPALELAAHQLPRISAAVAVAAGLLLGGAAFALANRWVPHEHFIKGREGANPERLRRIWLFVLAITLHNFPEGLAVGVGFGTEQVSNGTALAVGIALQNMPEGLVVALALRGEGESRGYAFWVALATGLVEPIGALLGAGAVAASALLLPGGLALAAGAMLYVISDEIIPESHRAGTEAMGTYGLLGGFALMMVLDVAIG